MNSQNEKQGEALELGTLSPMQFLRKKENGKEKRGDTVDEEESIQDSFLRGLHRFSSEMPFAGALGSDTLGALGSRCMKRRASGTPFWGPCIGLFRHFFAGVVDRDVLGTLDEERAPAKGISELKECTALVQRCPLRVL